MGSIPRRDRGCGCASATAKGHVAHLKLNGRSEFFCGSAGTLPLMRSLLLTVSEEDNMRKSGYVIAALATLAVAAPSIASADTVVIKHRDHHWLGARAEYREHRDHGWHRGWW